jgi:hypothetical protein
MLITIQSLKERRIAIYREEGVLRVGGERGGFSSTAGIHVLGASFSS